MKVEMSVGRGISAGPSLGAARIGGGIGMRPMGFGGMKGPESAMSMGARTLSKAWSPINIGRVEKGTGRPFLAPREPKMTPFGRKPMNNIDIRSTIQRRLQGARYQGAPEVTTNKGIGAIQIEPPIIPNIQRVSTPDRRAVRVLSLVGSRMPFAVSRETPATTLNLAQKRTETPKGMEVVFPTQPRPKIEVRVGQVINPATTPAISAETAQALRAVSALRKAGMVDQARKVMQNLNPLNRPDYKMAQMTQMTEKTKLPVKTKTIEKKRQEDIEDKSGAKKVMLVRDKRALKARFNLVIKAVRKLFSGKASITGEELINDLPSTLVQVDIKSGVVEKNEKRPDYTWDSHFKEDLRRGNFASEQDALIAANQALEKHEPVTVAKDGKRVGHEALLKVHNPKDAVLRRVDFHEQEIVMEAEQKTKTVQEAVWVDGVKVSEDVSTQTEESNSGLDHDMLRELGIMPDKDDLLNSGKQTSHTIVPQNANLDLSALGIMPDFTELLKTAA